MLTVKPNSLENRPAGRGREHDSENKNCCCRTCEPIQALVAGLPTSDARRRWFLMYQAYLDDSGRGSGSAYVIAGFLANTESWLHFSSKWGKLLSDLGLESFKMKEAMNPRAGETRRSPFAGWPRKDIDYLIECLTDGICTLAPMRIRITVPNKEYAQIFKGKIARQVDFPYWMAHVSAMLETTRLLADYRINEKVDFIFDTASGREQFYVLSAWHFWKSDEWHEGRKPLFNNPPIFRDDKEFLPLQAADLYAWQARKERQLLADGMIYDHPSWKALNERIKIVAERDWTEDDLRARYRETEINKVTPWAYDKRKR